MSQIAEVPVLALKPTKMFSYWSFKMKVGAVLVLLALYVYILMFVKGIYLKSKRLDHIMTMAMDTEKLMQKVKTIDQNLALKIERLDEMYEDY